MVLFKTVVNHFSPWSFSAAGFLHLELQNLRPSFFCFSFNGNENNGNNS